MSHPFRTGYVGAGVLAQKVHLRNLRSLPDFDVVALAEVRPELGRAVQEQFGIARLYGDHRALADDEAVEIVVISGNYADQGEIAIVMLEAGKSVLVEKPMAVSVEQAERVVEAERGSTGRLMVAYMKRFDAANIAAKEAIAELRATSALGALTFARSHNFCGNWLAGSESVAVLTTNEQTPPPVPAAPSWLPDATVAKYLGYLQVYTHNVNLLRWLLGAGTADTEVICADLADDGRSGLALLSVAGVRTSLETGTSRFHAWDDVTQVYFEGGWVKVSAAPLLVAHQPSLLEIYRSDDTTLRHVFPPSGWTWPYLEELKHFASCLRSGAPFRSPVDDALADVRVFELIYSKYLSSERHQGAPAKD